MAALDIRPIGHVRGGRDQPIDDDWGKSRARLELDPARFTPDALAGLADFSHAEVIFQFNRVPDDKIETGARRPRGRADWPLVGIFAQRGKNRPNRIGLCTCRIVAVDGTPILDIKPVMAGFLPRGEVREPEWSLELMRDYW